MRCWLVSFANRTEPSSLILSFCEFHAVIIETFRKSFSANLGLLIPGPVMRVRKYAMSSWVQALYRIFSRALRNFASSGDYNFCLIFSLKRTTVVTWCHNAFPMQILYH